MTFVRILHVSPAHPPTDPRIVHKLVPALAGQYEVICLLPGAKAAKTGNTRFIGLPFFRWLGWRLLVVHPLILGYLIRFRPAILHIYMPELVPLALLCRLMGVAVIYEVQENLRLKFDRKPRNNHVLFRWAFSAFERLARQHCHHIFTEESYLKTYTDLRLPHAIIHNYPDPEFFDAIQTSDPAETPPADGPHLLYAGVVSVDRGLATMIQAIALLKATYPAIKLHLFGRCMVSPSDLQALPDYPAVQPHLIFYGHTDPRIVYARAYRYTAGLALLKPVGDYPDSYPTKMFDYMALGLPVITADFPLYRAVVETVNCGYCLGPANSLAVAERITWLLDNPREAKAMGKRGKSAVAITYNWQTEASHLLEFYQKIAIT